MLLDGLLTCQRMLTGDKGLKTTRGINDSGRRLDRGSLDMVDARRLGVCHDDAEESRCSSGGRDRGQVYKTAASPVKEGICLCGDVPEHWDSCRFYMQASTIVHTGRGSRIPATPARGEGLDSVSYELAEYQRRNRTGPEEVTTNRASRHALAA